MAVTIQMVEPRTWITTESQADDLEPDDESRRVLAQYLAAQSR